MGCLICMNVKWASNFFDTSHSQNNSDLNKSATLIFLVQHSRDSEWQLQGAK